MLKKFFVGLCLAWLGATFPNGPAQADQPNLLIMGEDADVDTVPRNSRIFNRVLRAMEAELQARGFRVYDETAVTMDFTDPGRVRRTDAEIITVARRVQGVPIDVATVFQIYASAEENPYAAIVDLRARISGRLLNVSTGQALANYEVSYGRGDLPPLPVACDRDCVLEHVGDQARRIGADVANVLAQHLDALSPARGAEAATPGIAVPGQPGVTSSDCAGLTTAYTMNFRGFAGADLTRIEEYLVSFSGYDHHRIVRTDTVESSYWYETCADIARLNRNLRLMLEAMDLDANIRLTGNRFDIEKLRTPQQR